MNTQASPIEEEMRANFNRSKLQSKREEENNNKLETRSNPIVVMSFWERFNKYWPILIVAAFFDLLALIPFLSVIINFCFGIVMFFYFGKKKVVSGIIAPIVIGSIIDFFLSLILISLWPACLAAAVTRIALKETMG